ncbi:MAG: type 4a pilus biogenesis protein PilO [Planctomycetes bacterium]|nr:type 4a pilus biogenesis protein PilO [Planctomycetota bacterium]
MQIERDQVRTLAATGILCAAFVVAMWLPHAMKERDLRARIEKSRQAIEQDRAKTTVISDLSARVAGLKHEVDASKRYVAAESEVPSMLRDLSRELEARKVTEQEIQTQAVVECADFRVLPVSLRFKGSIESVMGFLNKIESMRQVLRVSRFELTHDAEPASTLLTARVELSAFYAPAEAQTR